MKISIIGTGIYSIALALTISDNSHQITMWSEQEKYVKVFNKTHNFKPIINKKAPNNITITSNIQESLNNTDFILIATSAKYVREVCLKIQKHIDINTPICLASKGIENDTCSFLTDIVKNILKSKNISVISGPTFACDLINKEPCALSLSSTTKKASNMTLKALKTPYLKLRINNDLYGTQICGSIKNVIAIASGILDGLNHPESTIAFLLTESIHDIKELLYALECNPKTILSFAGIGDLILTASSPKSRNYQLGKLLGQKAPLKEIENFLNKNTTEGYYTLLSIKELTKNRKINTPIIDIIYDIAINNKNPEILSEFLINKD